MELCTTQERIYFDHHLLQNKRIRNDEAVTYSLQCRGKFSSKLNKLTDTSQATSSQYVVMYGKTPLYRAHSDDVAANKRFVQIRLLRYDADSQTYVRNTRGYDVCTIFHLVKSLAIDFDCKFFPRRTVVNGNAWYDDFRRRMNRYHMARILRYQWELAREKKYERDLQLRRMKTMTIYGDVTLYQFLVVGQNKLIVYMRNEEFVNELDKAICEFEFYHPRATELRTRFAEAIQLEELREKAVNAICWLMNSKNNAFYYVAKDIIDYLSEKDMKILCSLQNE